MGMKASVIMTTLNENKIFLKKAIESYLSQTVPVQLIICTVEGDVNIDFINQFINKIDLISVPLSKHPGRSPIGSFYQLNYALEFINTDWFCFASSNDIAELNKIEQEISLCEKLNKQICYSDFNLIDEEDNFIRKQSFHDYEFDKHLKGNFVSDCALIKTELLNKNIPFRSKEFGNYAYWDLWLRIYKTEGNVFCYNQYPTWNYRQNADAMHVKRKQNPELILQFEKDKQKMLSQYL